MVVLVDFRRRYAEFSCQNFDNFRTTETALASAHTRANSTLYRVYALCAQGTMDSVQNLPFRYRFAAANDIAVQGVLFDKFVLFFGGLFAEFNYALTRFDIVFLKGEICP